MRFILKMDAEVMIFAFHVSSEYILVLYILLSLTTGSKKSCHTSSTWFIADDNKCTGRLQVLWRLTDRDRMNHLW